MSGEMERLRESVQASLRETCQVECPCCGYFIDSELFRWARDQEGDVIMEYHGNCTNCGLIIDLKGNTW